MANLTGEQPDYAKLKCPKCGNVEDFKGFALTPTAQRLSVNGGEVDWKETEFLDDTTFPQEVRCAKCDAVVWEPQAPKKEVGHG